MVGAVSSHGVGVAPPHPQPLLRAEARGNHAAGVPPAQQSTDRHVLAGTAAAPVTISRVESRRKHLRPRRERRRNHVAGERARENVPRAVHDPRVHDAVAATRARPVQVGRQLSEEREVLPCGAALQEARSRLWMPEGTS